MRGDMPRILTPGGPEGPQPRTDSDPQPWDRSGGRRRQHRLRRVARLRESDGRHPHPEGRRDRSVQVGRVETLRVSKLDEAARPDGAGDYSIDLDKVRAISPVK